MDSADIHFPVSFELRLIYEPANSFEDVAAKVSECLRSRLVSFAPAKSLEPKGRFGRLAISLKFLSLEQMRSCYGEIAKIEGVKAII
jgi:putative lipoic acid-binding regulatory protein